MIKIAYRISPSFANRLIRRFFALSVACAGLLLSSQAVHAETLYFSPSSGTYVVGKTFTVNVMVSTPDQAANAYSGTVTFPADKLEVTAIGKGGSIVNVWAEEPNFTSTKASFEGVTFTPGYKGKGAKIISLTFKAKAAGTAAVRLTSGSILANDGMGTNILTGLGGASFTLTAAGVQPPTPPTPPAPPGPIVGIPDAPIITSPTQPDQAAWYAIPDMTVAWGLQNGVDGVSVLVDQIPNSDPGTVSQGLFASYSRQNVKDGVWYVHVRVHNKNGWSPVSHFRFQIDTTKPDYFNITEITPTDPTRQARSFTFDAKDTGSGIDHYEVQMDDGVTDVWRDDGSHVYQAPSVGPGTHSLVGQAIDMAGNARVATAAFTVIAPPASLSLKFWGWLQGVLLVLLGSPLFFPMLALSILAALFIILRSYRRLEHGVDKRVYAAQEALHAAFDTLRDDIRDTIRLLEKIKSSRNLTHEEGKILGKLKRDLKMTEDAISKKIRYIKKDR